MIILIDSSQRTITVLADNGFPWKFNEKDPYVAKCGDSLTYRNALHMHISTRLNFGYTMLECVMSPLFSVYFTVLTLSGFSGIILYLLGFSNSCLACSIILQNDVMLALGRPKTFCQLHHNVHFVAYYFPDMNYINNWPNKFSRFFQHWKKWFQW